MIDTTKAWLTEFDVKQVVRSELKFYNRYDPAHDGRTVVYVNRSKTLRAVLG